RRFLLSCAVADHERFANDRAGVLTGSLKVPAEVKLWDAATGKEAVRLRGPVELVFSLAFRPDGRRLALTHPTGLVTVWDTADGRLLQPLRGPDSQNWSAAFSPDARWIAAVGIQDETARFWDAASGSEVLPLRGVRGCLAFSPDRRHVATAGA